MITLPSHSFQPTEYSKSSPFAFNRLILIPGYRPGFTLCKMVAVLTRMIRDLLKSGICWQVLASTSTGLVKAYHGNFHLLALARKYHFSGGLESSV
jgi:hypothetical protein